jgi:molecular chaperone IbpA
VVETLSLVSMEDMTMRIDFSPLYRSTVGFDRLFSLMDGLGAGEAAQPTYPPYNIERTAENAYRITMAVAGFGSDELGIELKENTLTVKGEKTVADEKHDVLYRGIASRSFERRFQLADHMQVEGAALENGLLHIDLARRVPEELKPRRIPIAQATSAARLAGSSEIGAAA